jgi:hypothetical protein
MDIPKGATHFSKVYGHLSFWRHGLERYCFEFEPEGEVFYRWQMWSPSLEEWLKEESVSARHFKPISELNEQEV